MDLLSKQKKGTRLKLSSFCTDILIVPNFIGETKRSTTTYAVFRIPLDFL